MKGYIEIFNVETGVKKFYNKSQGELDFHRAVHSNEQHFFTLCYRDTEVVVMVKKQTPFILLDAEMNETKMKMVNSFIKKWKLHGGRI